MKFNVDETVLVTFLKPDEAEDLVDGYDHPPMDTWITFQNQWVVITQVPTATDNMYRAHLRADKKQFYYFYEFELNKYMPKKLKDKAKKYLNVR